MSAKHTPGPWNISLDDDLWLLVIGDGKIVANVNPESFHGGVADFVEMPAEANARLIAAAPELLEVARGILAEDMIQYLPADYVIKVRAAIAAAEGKRHTGDAADADGWIEWNGGECPVNRNSVVDFKLRAGLISQGNAGCLRWANHGFESDIVAYRAVKQGGAA